MSLPTLSTCPLDLNILGSCSGKEPEMISKKFLTSVAVMPEWTWRQGRSFLETKVRGQIFKS